MALCVPPQHQTWLRAAILNGPFGERDRAGSTRTVVVGRGWAGGGGYTTFLAKDGPVFDLSWERNEVLPRLSGSVSPSALAKLYCRTPGRAVVVGT
eukprot:1378197-Rhodomonas_salina.1